MTFNPDTLAKEILEAVEREREEAIRIGLDTARNIERLKNMGFYDKKRKEGGASEKSENEILEKQGEVSMKRKKSSEDNVMLDMDPSLISYFRARAIEERAIEELERKKKEIGFYEKKEEKTDINKNSKFAVIKAMDDMRARVIVNEIENFLSKIIPKKFRKK